jgi:UDP-4-amino-4,6-dideoxy-N-acetyl-beta-L-altrosamine transaminase
MSKIIPYGKHFVDNKDINYVIRAIKNSDLTQGPMISKFEKKLSNFVNAKYSVAVSSATAGLHISCKALGFKKNSLLLTSVISFVSTSNVAYFLDGKVKFVDIDPNTISFDLKDLELKIKKFKPKIIIVVHMAGCAFNMKKIKFLSIKYKFSIIEDCAHALGGMYDVKNKVGSCKYSDISVFSFHPVKTITTGEGGMITTNNKKIYKKLLRYRSHGINKLDDIFLNKKNAYTNGKINPWYYEMQELGYHYRITDIQCALGVSQLSKIYKFLKKRKDVARRYDLAFSDNLNIELIHSRFRNVSANHLYVIKINFRELKRNREELMRYLLKAGIRTQVHYIPIVMHPYYSKKGFKISEYPNAKKYYDNCISLPCYYSLSIKDQKKIINHINKFTTQGYLSKTL